MKELEDMKIQMVLVSAEIAILLVLVTAIVVNMTEVRRVNNMLMEANQQLQQINEELEARPQ
jgi:signal transduction histidine kinase